MTSTERHCANGVSGVHVGVLYFGSNQTPISMDDRLLASLAIATASKLRRNEGFMVSWRDHVVVGDGRSTVWINTASELHFKYSAEKPPAINRDEVNRLVEASMRSGGIELDHGSLTQSPPPPTPTA